jgi:tetratricopeptide (TPR) repeat protein
MTLTPDAIELWRQNIAKSTRANYLYEMGRALIAQGDKDEGLRRVRSSLELYPALHAGRCFLIDHLREEGAHEEAGVLQTRALADFPNFSVAYNLFQAQSRIREGNLAEARSFLTAVIATSNPDDAVHCWQEIMGQQLQSGSPPEDLLVSAEAILAINGTIIKALEVAGINALLLGRYGDAARHLDRFWAENKNNISILLFSGMARHCAGQFQDALARFDQILQCTPPTEHERLQFHAGAHAHRAGSFLCINDLASADEAIRAALAVSRDDFRTQAFMALVRGRQGHSEDAAKAAKAALSVHTNHPFALLILAYELSRQGQEGKALEVAAQLRSSPAYLTSTMLDLAPWLMPVILPLAARADIPLRQTTGA